MEIKVMTSREIGLSRRQAIVKYQQAIQALPRDGDGPRQVGPEHFPVRHHFAPYTYGREMYLPADSTVVGKIHKHAHLNVLSRGRVRVFTEHEGEVELVAPCTFVSVPQTKRAVVVLEDAVWTTMHVVSMPTPGIQDLPEIERELIATDFKEDL